jgi:hypothetical protein
MSYAKWLALLVAPFAIMGCITPCQRVASEAIALDKDCAKVSLDKGDGQLASACASAYGYVKRGLATGSCSNEVGTR